MENTNSRKKGYTLVEVLVTGALVASLALTTGVVYAGYVGVQALSKYVKRPEVQRANVIGGEKAELFVERDGRRFYAEIDGKSLEDSTIQK